MISKPPMDALVRILKKTNFVTLQFADAVAEELEGLKPKERLELLALVMCAINNKHFVAQVEERLQSWER